MTSREEARTRLLAQRSFALDDFQVKAMDAIDDGDSVLVAAPTGSGKTLVAEYAVSVALAEGNKVFYTTPLKALSNQKYHDLVRAHGSENVGLLTGDASINGDAPAVVMTTEVLRNMIYANSPALVGLQFVVLDEVHYLQNAYRGPVWEEVIIHAPADVTLVCLSATVSNAEELTEWIKTVRGSTVAVIEEKRPVVLNHFYMVSARNSGHATMIPTFNANGRPNPRGPDYDNKISGAPWKKAPTKTRYVAPLRAQVIEHLETEHMLPAIYFIFSRNGCDDAVKQCLNEGVRLTTSDEREQIRAIAESKVDLLSDEDLRVLDYGNWLVALENGVAAHHAGMVPPFKEAVEACFALALVKVVFATETLALGINMPARTVVIEKLSKFTGERHEMLTPGEYTQLTGRAGRRGIDDTGNAVVLWSHHTQFEQVASLAGARSYTLTSSFRPTYNMAVNLVRRYPPDVARHLLNLSFAQFRADVDVVRLETQLERAGERIEVARQKARCQRGDIEAWRKESQLDETIQKHDTPEHIAKAVSHLKVGDVIQDPGSKLQRHLMVVTTTQRRGHDPRVGVLTRDGRRFSLTTRDFSVAPHRAQHVELPKPYNPGNKEFVKRAAASLRENVSEEADEFVPRGYETTGGVAGCPDLAEHLKAMTEVDRLTRERDRLEKRVKGRAESLARQFDRVLALLRDLGYVDNWLLTSQGDVLARLYHESDLLIAECLRAGLFDGLDAPSVAALVSMFTYESRGPAGSGPEPHFSTGVIADRWIQIERVWQELAGREHEAALTSTRAPDPGFCGFAYAWVAGKELSDVLEAEEISGGDFVRNVRQLMDLLRQIGDLATDRDTARAARQAADQLFRGVVSASSVTEAQDEEDDEENDEPVTEPPDIDQ